MLPRMSSNTSSTKDRMPDAASDCVEASQLRSGNSVHNPTNSSSSADQMTVKV